MMSLQVTFYSTQSVGTPAPAGTPPSPAVQLLDPDQAAQTLATQAATNTTALFVTSPELVSDTLLHIHGRTPCSGQSVEVHNQCLGVPILRGTDSLTNSIR
jgi:hypothetical protein